MFYTLMHWIKASAKCKYLINIYSDWFGSVWSWWVHSWLSFFSYCECDAWFPQLYEGAFADTGARGRYGRVACCVRGGCQESQRAFFSGWAHTHTSAHTQAVLQNLVSRLAVHTGSKWNLISDIESNCMCHKNLEAQNWLQQSCINMLLK